MNPLLDRYAKKRHGTKSEKRVARSVGARTTPGSGSLPGRKGDSELPEMLIESKCTVNSSLSVKHEWLRKIEREALEKNRAPALTLSFVHDSGEAKPAGDWIAIPLWLAKQLGILQ